MWEQSIIMKGIGSTLKHHASQGMILSSPVIELPSSAGGPGPGPGPAESDTLQGLPGRWKFDPSHPKPIS